MGKKVNKNELSKILGKSVATISLWQKEKNFPIEKANAKSKGNIYDTAEVIEWIIIKKITQLNAKEDGEFLSLDAERARLAKMQADKIELFIAQEKKISVMACDVTDHWSKMILSARAKILSIPSRTFSAFDSSTSKDDFYKNVEQICYDALTEISTDELP